MAIELLEMSTEEFLTFINKYPEFGDFTVQGYEEFIDTFPQMRPGDVGIYHDYCTDDCRGSSKENEFFRWLDKTHRIVDQFMREKGYKMVDECDGSGGGLWYGGALYRKI